MRLIDAERFEELFNQQVDLGATDLFDAVEDALQDTESIDPETLPIVKELRKELERVTRERDALIWDMKVFGSGCYSCKHFDVINKKCKANEPCGVNNNWEWKGIQWEE
jgi:hypothetical protein